MDPAGVVLLRVLSDGLVVGHAAARRHGGSLFLLRDIGDDRLGGQQHGGHGGGVLQTRAGHLQPGRSPRP